MTLFYSSTKMDKRVLISVGVSALLFGLFCVFSLSWALSDDTKMTDGEDLPHSFPMLNRNRNKRAIGAAIGIVGIGISIIDLVASNIRQTFDNSETKKSHQQLISHFEQIHEQLQQQKEELESINREIQKLGLSVIFFQHETKIRDSLLTLREYLENSNERYRKRFIDKATDLDLSIRVLIDGLLGQSHFGPDIMAIMQVATECHGRKLRNSVQSVESLVMTGLYVRRQYQRIDATEFSKRSPFKEYIDTSLIKLEKRLNDKVIECYDEKNVGAEMGKILKATLTHGREVVANSLLEFLEEKYENKKWIVIMQRNNNWDLDSIWTGGFHQATVENHVVLALSVDRDRNFTEFKNLIQLHLKEFRIPLNSKLESHHNYREYNNIHWNCFIGSLRIEEYLKRFLIPVLVKSGIEMETLVSVDTRPQKDLIIKTSKEVEEQQVVSSFHQFNGGSCHEIKSPLYSIILIPTKRLKNQTKCSYSSDNEAHQDYGPLRNEFSQAYLSVQGDSDKKGAYIVMDSEWRNSPGQKWKFVNGQLKNGFGKCFTKWDKFHTSIYQYDCDHNWDGQKWSLRSSNC